MDRSSSTTTIGWSWIQEETQGLLPRHRLPRAGRRLQLLPLLPLPPSSPICRPPLLGEHAAISSTLPPPPRALGATVAWLPSCFVSVVVRQSAMAERMHGRARARALYCAHPCFPASHTPAPDTPPAACTWPAPAPQPRTRSRSTSPRRSATEP